MNFLCHDNSHAFFNTWMHVIHAKTGIHTSLSMYDMHPNQKLPHPSHWMCSSGHAEEHCSSPTSYTNHSPNVHITQKWTAVLYTSIFWFANNVSTTELAQHLLPLPPASWDLSPHQYLFKNNLALSKFNHKQHFLFLSFSASEMNVYWNFIFQCLPPTALSEVYL